MFHFIISFIDVYHVLLQFSVNINSLNYCILWCVLCIYFHLWGINLRMGRCYILHYIYCHLIYCNVVDTVSCIDIVSYRRRYALTCTCVCTSTCYTVCIPLSSLAGPFMYAFSSTVNFRLSGRLTTLVFCNCVLKYITI